MKPAAFTYHRADTMTHAVEVLAELGDDARILAGGQSLLPLMNLRMVTPRNLIDISKTTDLMTIEDDDDGVKIGAAATYRMVAKHHTIDEFPIVGRAISHVGYEPIRNRGTVVGSIAHNDPAGELPAVALVLDAEVGLRSVRGCRSVSIDDFLTGAYSTTIDDDELIESVSFPRPVANAAYGFAEYARRPGDYASAGVACQVRYRSDGSVAGCRIATFACGGAVLRHPVAEDHAVALGSGGLNVGSAAQAVAAGIGEDDDRYSRRLVEHLATDALGQTAWREPGACEESIR